jgi:hypothetical protein
MRAWHMGVALQSAYDNPWRNALTLCKLTDYLRRDCADAK